MKKIILFWSDLLLSVEAIFYSEILHFQESIGWKGKILYYVYYFDTLSKSFFINEIWFSQITFLDLRRT